MAIKFIMKCGKSPKDLDLLRQEIKILEGLKHENIVQMVDSFESSTDICVVTEFAQGKPLDMSHPKQRYSARAATKIIESP